MNACRRALGPATHLVLGLSLLLVPGAALGLPLTGAAEITGIAIGAGHTRGAVIAPAYFRVGEEGSQRGVAFSALNDIRGQTIRCPIVKIPPHWIGYP